METTKELSDAEFIRRIEAEMPELRNLPNLQAVAARLLALARKGMALDREADWLADRLVDLCKHRYEPDCRVLYDPEVTSKTMFREAAKCQAR